MNLKTTSQASLKIPLEIDEKIESVVNKVNKIYQLNLVRSNYLDRTVSLDQTGRLRIDLINHKSGLVEWIVKDNQSLSGESGEMIEEIKILVHPKSLQHPEIMKYQALLINSKKELDFLTNNYSGEQNNLVQLEKARQLMELLNQYKIGLGWSCNPDRANTTADFKLLYIGEYENLPEQYKLNPNVAYVAIVELKSMGVPVVYSLSVG
ncbi:hypothetical protein [Aeromonas phage AerS_266]|nr:hypothetical protein [Aeromonas phage AerS_266]